MVNVLEGLYVTVQHIEQRGDLAANTFVLRLDPVAREIQISGFPGRQERLAYEKYFEVDEIEEHNPNSIHAVLVSVDSLAELRRAYPNYYLDTASFVYLVKGAISDDEPAPDRFEDTWVVPTSGRQ